MLMSFHVMHLVYVRTRGLASTLTTVAPLPAFCGVAPAGPKGGGCVDVGELSCDAEADPDAPPTIASPGVWITR